MYTTDPHIPTDFLVGGGGGGGGGEGELFGSHIMCVTVYF